MAGPDGNLWFTESGGNKIGVLTTGGTFIHEYALSEANSEPEVIVTGRDGRLWFTEAGANKIGAVDIGGVMTDVTLEDLTDPDGLTSLPEGDIWFTRTNGDPALAGISTSGTAIGKIALPPQHFPCRITSAPDGSLWFTEFSSGKIGHVTPPKGTPVEYGDTSPMAPDQIVYGPDGNVWFTDGLGTLGRIQPDGSITRYAVPSADAEGITVGPDGNLWFTEFRPHMVGRFVIP